MNARLGQLKNTPGAAAQAEMESAGSRVLMGALADGALLGPLKDTPGEIAQ